MHFLPPVVIEQHPVDDTVFPGQDAEFVCGSHGCPTHWHLNENDINDLPTTLRNDIDIDCDEVGSLNLSVLTITAKAEYSGIKVHCVIESDDGDSVVSNTATLYVQGK